MMGPERRVSVRATIGPCRSQFYIGRLTPVPTSKFSASPRCGLACLMPLCVRSADPPYGVRWGPHGVF
eukprot:9490000-Pyramimonas_sp.AAC.2